MKWYAVTFRDMSEVKYWEQVFEHSSVLVSEDDFWGVCRSFRHTMRRCHYVEVTEKNWEAMPDHIKFAYKHRDEYKEVLG